MASSMTNMAGWRQRHHDVSDNLTVAPKTRQSEYSTADLALKVEIVSADEELKNIETVSAIDTPIVISEESTSQRKFVMKKASATIGRGIRKKGENTPESVNPSDSVDSVSLSNSQELVTIEQQKNEDTDPLPEMNLDQSKKKRSKKREKK